MHGSAGVNDAAPAVLSPATCSAHRMIPPSKTTRGGGGIKGVGGGGEGGLSRASYERRTRWWRGASCLLLPAVCRRIQRDVATDSGREEARGDVCGGGGGGGSDVAVGVQTCTAGGIVSSGRSKRLLVIVCACGTVSWIFFLNLPFLRATFKTFQPARCGSSRRGSSWRRF